MDEQRKYAILFAATILAARKLNDPRHQAGAEPPGVLIETETLVLLAPRQIEPELAMFGCVGPLMGRRRLTCARHRASVMQAIKLLLPPMEPSLGYS